LVCSRAAFFFFATFLLGKEKWRSEFFLEEKTSAVDAKRKWTLCFSFGKRKIANHILLKKKSPEFSNGAPG